MTFRITALPAEDFAHLSGMDARQLAARLVQRKVADRSPGYPCRVSLEDARPGETVFLLNHVHLDAATPFRASHAIYVREGAKTASPAAGTIPHMLCSRIISLRAFDRDAMLLNADIASGEDLPARIEDLFRDPAADYIHLHFAKQGCFAARVGRS